MPESDAQTESANLETFQECLSGVIIRQLARPSAASLAKGQRKPRAGRGRKTAIKAVDRQSEDTNSDAEELSDFTEVHVSPLHTGILPD